MHLQSKYSDVRQVGKLVSSVQVVVACAHLQRGGVGRADKHAILGAVGHLQRARCGAAQAANSLTYQLSLLTYQLEPQRLSRS